MRIQTLLTMACLSLFGMAALQAQTQYDGPNGGEWFLEDNWDNGLPANGNDPLIGGGVTVNIGSPLNINFNITNFGGILASAAITNNGTISNSGTFDLTATGSLTNNATFNNFGTSSLAGPASFVNETGAIFTNIGTFTLQTTLVNRGSVTNNGTINATAGTLLTEGNFDNAQTLTTQSLTVQTTSTFTNNFGANLTISGGAALLQVNGSFNNLGTVTAAGNFTVNGTFSNNSNVTVAGILTVNTGGVFNNGGGTVNTQTGVQNFGTFINGFKLVNTGDFSNFGQFNNNDLVDNQLGGIFTNRPAGIISMGFGSKILNGGNFTNQNAINSFGTIENNSAFTNTGTINSFSGSLVDNNGAFNSSGTISTNDQVLLDGPFTNSGTINVNGGSVWRNNDNFTNTTTGKVTVLQDFINLAGGDAVNNGRWTNLVRTRNEGTFTNNALFEILAENLTNTAGATFTNNELLLLTAGNLRNDGSLVNTDKVFSDDCSSIRNSGNINNSGSFEVHGLFFQYGTMTGTATNCQGCYVHTAPTSSAPSVCQNGTFGADINGEVKVYSGALIAFANFDSCANIVSLANGVDRPVFTCDDIGTVQNVNLLVRTRLGDSLTCVAQVTPVDLLEPQISNCPNDRVIFTPNSTATATWTAPTATDNCSTVTLTSTHTPGSSFPVGITGVTYTATDIYNNQGQCQFRIDVRQTPPGSNCTGDIAGPTFTACPTNLSVTAVGNSTPVTWAPPTPNDNCKPITLTASNVPGQGFPVGTTTVTYTATDGNNNSSTCTFTVTVNAVDPCLNDVQKPIIVGCPANIWLPTNPVINGAVAIWNAPGAADNCGVTSFTATHVSGAVFAAGTTNVAYTATDAAGNSSTCSFVITVGADPCPGDVTAPAISGCPANISLLTTGSTATATWTAPTASDPCGPVTVNNTHAPGATFGLGVTQVTYQFSDKKGNKSTCSFTVTVQNACSVDNVPPVIAGCPANITVAATGASGAPAAWTPPAATDNCGIASFTASFQPGANFPIGTTTVVYSAIDLKGNSSNCSFNVIVVTGPACTTNASPINGTTGVNPASVTLSWNSATNATSYDVYLGTTNPPTTTVATNVAGTSTTVTNLAGGTTYFWYVVPKNAAGSATGCASSVTSFSTQGGSTGGCNKNALYVVGSTTLVASDAAVKSRLESLGYTVTLKTGPTAATADATGKGLVIISSTVTAAEVNTKFRNVAVPVIVYENLLMDDMNMTGTTSGTHYGTTGSVSQMVVQTPAHPMAAGLSGSVSVLSAAGTVAWGNPGAAATRIGHVPGNTSRAMIYGYETGAAMVGLNAPARRVGLFLFDNTANTLSANGLKLFDAAIFWATGCPPCTLAPTAVCKNITLQLTTIGQSVQINGQQLDNGSTPGCSGTILTYNASPNSFSQPGTYTATLTVTNSLGLSATCTSTVTVLAPPCVVSNTVCEANVNDAGWQTLANCAVSVCVGNKLILSVNPNGLATYQWSGPNGYTATGNAGGDALISNSITAAQAGNYSVTLTDAAGCTAVKTIAVTVTTCTTCNNVTNGGTISKTCSNNQVSFTNVALPTGGSGTIEYVWISGTTGCNTNNMAPVAGSNSPTLTVAPPSSTTYYIRCSRRSGCTNWDGESNCITVFANECAPANTCVGNLLVNPGFESGTAGWTWMQNAGTTTTSPFAGAKSLQICSASGGISQYIPALPGVVYTLKVFAKISGATGSVGLKFFDSNWVEIAAPSVAVTATNYTQYTVTATAPFNAAYVESWAWKNTNGCFYADDYCLTSSMGFPACSNNLLANENPGFESNFTSWEWVNNATITTSNVHGGAKAAQVCTGAGGAGNQVLATPGATYSLQLWAKTSGTPAWAGASITFYNANWEKIGVEISRKITATDWSLYLIQGIAPVNAKYVDFSFWKDPNGCLYVDDFCVSATGGGCSNGALFVVGSTNLGAGDVWVKNRLEMLGLTVVVKSATSVTSADATGKGVVVISSTINSTDVNTKFTNTNVPVVTWESYILDDLKMTGTGAGTDYGQNGNYSSLAINDPGHPLSAGMSGTVQVLTSANSMRWGWTTAAAAAKAAKISGQESKYGIFGFEKNTAMHGGFTAPARRVSLFLDDTTPTLLTANGAKLFDAAMEWAVGCNLALLTDEAVTDRGNTGFETTIDPTANEQAVTVYPNPAQDEIFVKLAAFEGQEVILRLFDARGVLVRQWEIAASADDARLEMASYQSGQYLLWIFAEGGQPVTKKLVLERARP